MDEFLEELKEIARGFGEDAKASGINMKEKAATLVLENFEKLS
jgi:hypothetical protein